ncbi:MAG: Ig-like domain-containing protein [Saccharofermentanales bacterium]
MQKKILSIMLSLTFVLGISVFSTVNVLAATRPVRSDYEIIEDFENYTDPLCAANVQSGNIALDGESSFVFEGTASVINLPVLGKPTIANPTGVFFRIEATLPFVKGGGLNINYGSPNFTNLAGGGATNSWWYATWCPEAYRMSAFSSGKMQALVFAPMTVSADGVASLQITNLDAFGWAGTGIKGIIDDIGYYSVANPAAPDYTTIATELATDCPTNPAFIAGLSTGTFNSYLLSNASIKMVPIVYHSSGTYDWAVDNTTLATIDANGVLTAKHKGTVKVTIKDHLNNALSASTDVKIVFGYIQISCTDNNNTDKALFGLKMRLRGAPSSVMSNTNFTWSVVSGPATIADTQLDTSEGGQDVDMANVPDATAALVSFTGSGKVVVRATFNIDPTIYNEYVFNVAPNKTYLNQSIVEAGGYESIYYTTASWKTLQAALTNANKLYSSQTVTQDQLNAGKIALDAAIAKLAVADETAVSEPVSDNDNANPQTSSSPSLLTPALAVILLGGLIAALRKRKSINKGGY